MYGSIGSGTARKVAAGGTTSGATLAHTGFNTVGWVVAIITVTMAGAAILRIVRRSKPSAV